MTEHELTRDEERDWDGMAGDRFYSSLAWIRLCDSYPGSRSRVRVHRSAEGALLGGLAVTVPESLPLAPYRWNDRLRKAGLPLLGERGVVVGAEQGYQTHVLTAPGADRGEVVGELVDGLRTEHTTCVAMYLSTEDVRAARGAGVAAPPVLLEADTVIDLPEGGWEGYLGALPSSRRNTVRKEVRAFEDSGHTVTYERLEDVVDVIAPMAVSTHAKYGIDGSVEKYGASLRRHVAAMGDAAKVALCVRAGEETPVGFCLYYEFGGTVHVRWAGFDYERLVGAYEYFNLVYYAPVREAWRTGARRLHTGIKALQAKALRGARIRPLWLLDLSERSPLEAYGARVRRHNTAFVEALRTDPRTARALDPDWDRWGADT